MKTLQVNNAKAAVKLTANTEVAPHESHEEQRWNWTSETYHLCIINVEIIMQLCWQNSQQISSSFFPKDSQKPAEVSQDNAFLCAFQLVGSEVSPGICLTNTQNSRMRIEVEDHDTEVAQH